MRGRPPVLPGSVIIRHRIRFLRSCVISSFVILHREHSLRHRFKQAPCQNRRYSLCRIRHIFPSRFVTMPQGSPPRERPFSLHRRQRPPLPCSPCRMPDFRRCFPAIFLHFSQEFLSPPAYRRSAGRLSPFRQFLLSPPLFSVIPSFFCRIYVFILHSLYKENAGTNQPVCPCALPVTDIRRKDDELPSLDIVFFQLILQAGAWDPQPGRCVHDLPVAGLHGR